MCCLVQITELPMKKKYHHMSHQIFLWWLLCIWKKNYKCLNYCHTSSSNIFFLIHKGYSTYLSFKNMDVVTFNFSQHDKW